MIERNVVINIGLLKAHKSSLEKRNKPEKQRFGRNSLKLQIDSLIHFLSFVYVQHIATSI